MIDNVTGSVITDNGWTTATRTYTTVTTPTIDGYTPDKYFAGGDTVNVNDNNINRDITVTYAKNDTPVTPVTPAVVQGQVTYVDDTTGKTLSTDSFSGKVGDQITYKTAGKISSYEGQGYELVSNDFKDGNETFAQNGNNFTVHLKHGTLPVTSAKPGKPGQPINPRNPMGPKYPQGTDKLLTEITRTIAFVDEKGNQLRTPVKQTVIFTGSGVIDKVTGQWITPLVWNGNGQLSAQPVPSIANYHLANISRDGNSNQVIGVKVTPDDYSYTVTVTYVADEEETHVDKPHQPVENTQPGSKDPNEINHHPVTPSLTPTVPINPDTPILDNQEQLTVEQALTQEDKTNRQEKTATVVPSSIANTAQILSVST